MQTHCRSRRDSTGLTNSPVLKFRNRCQQFSQGRRRVPGYLSWIPVCLEGTSGTAARSTLTSLWPALLNVWRKASVPWMEKPAWSRNHFSSLLFYSLLVNLQTYICMWSFTRDFAGLCSVLNVLFQFLSFLSAKNIYNLLCVWTSRVTTVVDAKKSLLRVIIMLRMKRIIQPYGNVRPYLHNLHITQLKSTVCVISLDDNVWARVEHLR